MVQDFFDKAFLAVQPGTANFKLTTSGATSHVGIQAKHSTYNLLRLDFVGQPRRRLTRLLQ